MRSSRLLAAAATLVAGVSLVACSAKESAPDGSAKADGTTVKVTATDTDCSLSASQAGTGPTTFAVTNNGSKVTEFYVYGPDERVLAEVENISPGLARQLVVAFSDAGTYKVACKPGMVGDGIRREFTVNGASVSTQGAAVDKQSSAK